MNPQTCGGTQSLGRSHCVWRVRSTETSAGNAEVSEMGLQKPGEGRAGEEVDYPVRDFECKRESGAKAGAAAKLHTHTI